MQTSKPAKRVNWIFVGALIIIFPLILFTLFMTNVLPPYSRGVTTGIDSVSVDSTLRQNNMTDTSNNSDKR